MAPKLEITQNTYRKIERGETMLSLEKLISILAALEVDMNIFINFDENMVFNHCNQNDIINKNNPFAANSIEKVQELYERIITQKDAEIERLNNLLNSKIKLSNK
jgi:transcriptional regulator with XRE-family HTH domain